MELRAEYVEALDQACLNPASADIDGVIYRDPLTEFAVSVNSGGAVYLEVGTEDFANLRLWTRACDNRAVPGTLRVSRTESHPEDTAITFQPLPV
jgi:hypothetical protein